MKRILAGALLALLTLSTYATTFVPPALINPAGSTSGQAILSTGPTTSAHWATVTPAAIGGLTAASNLSDVASATAALTNLGGLSTTTAASTYATITNLALKAPLASPVFTGTVGAAAVTATGLITPSSTIGIKATATNDSAQAGSIGEAPTPTNLTNVPLTVFVTANAASVSLAPGNWIVSCDSLFTPTGTTAIESVTVGVSTTSATIGALGTYVTTPGNPSPGSGAPVATTPSVNLKLASTTTVYCVASSNFNTSTLTASGFLRAIRPR